jgi:hypothetical protein
MFKTKSKQSSLGRLYHTNGRPPAPNGSNSALIVTSASNSNNTPTYWLATMNMTGVPPATSMSCYPALPAEDTVGSIVAKRRTASSGLLMNIGYLDKPPTEAGTTESNDELTPLPRPASAGAAAEVVLYDYPPMTSGSAVRTSAASRHRGVNLRKQHSVNCASHCCEQKL